MSREIKSIISYFNEVVSRQGNHVALVMNDLTMTYETLRNYVDAIAHMLLYQMVWAMVNGLPCLQNVVLK